MSKSHKKTKADLGHVRSSIESIYIAVVLAFILRAFLVQAFVIPTGSMANSLYGEHYELECPSCHYEYPYGIPPHRATDPPIQRNKPTIPLNAQCPNCGYTYSRAGQKAKGVYLRGGDKVLVTKYLYDFAPPQRWDVVVFTNPQNNRENYIKRLIGLPGETLQVIQGDIFVSPDGGKTYQIARKPREAQDAMWYVVYDNDYTPDPEMMQAASQTAPKWTAADGNVWDIASKDDGELEVSKRVFRFNGSQAGSTIKFNPGDDGFAPICSYNANNSPAAGKETVDDICTDWMLSCVLTPDGQDDSQLGMTFTVCQNRFCAKFNTDGTVALLYQSRDADPNDPKAWKLWGQEKLEPFTAKNSKLVALSNVDYRVTLWVDGKKIISSTDEQYNDGYTQASNIMKMRRNYSFANSKLHDWYATPGIEISAKGAPLKLEHINIKRDVYYTTPRLDIRKLDDNNPQHRYTNELRSTAEKDGNAWPQDNKGYLAWGTFDNPIKLRKYPGGKNDLDEFFCLGDNSPHSLDGRGWVAAAPTMRLYDKDGKDKKPQYQLGTVPRYNIAGRALLVFWPSGFKLPVVNWALVPNVGRMRLIR